MGLRETIEIIIRAEDQANQVIKQNEAQIKKFGDAAKQANDKASKSSQQFQQKTGLTGKEVNSLSVKLRQVGENGKSSFDKLSKSEQDNLIKFNMLDKASQNLLQQINKVGNANFSGLSGAISDAQSKFQALDGVTKTWQGSLDYSRSKLELLGNDTDSLKGKIQVVGNAIPTYLGTKWDGLKSKVSSFGNFIKSSLSSALSSVRSKIESLGSAFSGLGGVISSAIGAMGMNSIKDMTIGLAFGREKVQSLTYAVYGTGAATDALWDKMDALTTAGVNNLDGLAQAMNTIKMSTGASTEELSYMVDVVNDIGQRAIMMGRSGDEAIGLMQAAGKGLNGEFSMLQDNFGITKDKLIDLGWSGAADDVKGYTDALQAYLDKGGSMDGLLDTTSGKLETFKKHIRIAGRSIGDDLMPYLNQGLDLLNEWTKPTEDGSKNLAQYAIGVLALGSGFATLAPTITPALQAFDMLTGKTKSLLVFLGLMSGAEDALTISTLSETLAQDMSTIAKVAGADAAVAETAANAGLTASFWAMATAILANPLTWVAVALVAVAVAVYEVGKSFGWWHDVGSMIEAIMNNIHRLWDAFINHPNVQATIQTIQYAWMHLNTALKPIVDWLKGIWDEMFPESAKGKVDGTRAIIDAIGATFQAVTTPIRLVASFLGMLYNAFITVRASIILAQAKFGDFGGFLATLLSPFTLVYSLLKQIVCILIGCSPGIVPALQAVQDAFSTVWDAIVSLLSGIIPTVISAIQPVLDILTMIGDFLLNTFLFAWQTMILVFTTVWNHLQVIISIFSQFLSGQITLQAMLSQIWMVVKSMFFSVLSLIISRASAFATQLWNHAVNAGRNFLNGVINYITNLPGRVASILANVLSRIISAGSQWVSNAKSKASAIVSGVISNVSQLPGKVYTEFMNIGSRMLSAGSDLVNKAKQIGKNIVDGLLNAMGIHSPGIIQTKVVSEFKDMVGKVRDWIKPAGETAKEFGETLVDEFGNPSLDANTSLIQDLDAPKMNVGVDTTDLNSANQDVITQYGNLALMTGDSLNSMVSQDKLAFANIKANDTAEMSIITTTVANKMSQMSNNVKTSMDNIVTKNKQSLLSAKNNTQTQLDSMVNKTKTANTKMISSWKGMANDVISFANKIKTQSSSHFDQLGSKIGSFYRKLQNPGGFGAGPAAAGGRVSTTTRRGGTNGLRAITNALRKAQMPQTMSLAEIRTNPLVSMDNIGSYITSNNNRFNVADLVRAGNIRIPVGLEDPFNKRKGAGAWLEPVGKHFNKIKSEADKWRMKGPVIIGKYPTSIGFKVGDFENGTPRIDFGTFKQMAEDVFGQTHYDFYYDEEKHGSWLGALRDGYLNCYHGAMALINFAQACGLSGSLVHGHWNQYGHYWANIAGHKMDVTGWQQQRNWTPAASHAGPAPKGLTFGEFVDAIKSTNENNPIVVVDGSNDADISGKVTVEHIHSFIDLPENISAEEVARLINDAPEDDSWLIKLIKLLVKNPDFQNLDLKEKLRLEAKDNRARGV